MQSANDSGFSALPQQDADASTSRGSLDSHSAPLVYDADARDHTQRSLNPPTIQQVPHQNSNAGQVGTALSPIDEHDNETPREPLYDPASPSNGGSYNHYYGPDDLGRAAPPGSNTAYHGANYEDWDATYKEPGGFHAASSQRPPNYKPCVFQLWFLALILFVVCAFLALSELAVHTLPDGTGGAASQGTHEDAGDLRPRNKGPGGTFIEVVQVRGEGNRLVVVRATSNDSVDAEVTTAPDQSSLSTFSFAPVLDEATPDGTELSSVPNDSSVLITASSLSGTDLSEAAVATTTVDSSVTSSSRRTTSSASETSTSVSTKSTSDVTGDVSMTSSTISSMTTPSVTTSSFGGNYTSSNPELLTCFETVFGNEDEPVTKTTTVPVVTVTVGGNATATAASPRPSSASSKTSSSHSSISCDVTITISIPSFPSSGTGTGTATQPYITIGQNTVTITLDGGADPIVTPPGPVDPPEPTSTCYYRTVTETEESDLVIATTTVTYDVIVKAGQPLKREKPTPVPGVDVPYYQRRACVDGGVFTVTQHIARPATVTETVWRTITQEDQIAILVVPPSTTTFAVTTEGSTFSTTEVLPAVTTTSVQMLPNGFGTTMKHTSTADNGEVVVNVFTAFVVPDDDNVVTTTSLVPVTTTDAQGNSVTTLQPTIVTKTRPKDDVVVITTTDSNGNTVVTTTPKPFSLLSEDELESTLIMVATTMTNSQGQPTLTTSALVWATPVTTTLTNAQGSATATETFLVLNGPQTTTFTDSEGHPSSTATFYLVTTTSTLTDANGMPTATSVITQTMTLSATTRTDSQGRPTQTATVLATASFPKGFVQTSPLPKPTTPPGPKLELQVFSITGAEYATGLIIPTLLATLLTLPIRILDHVAKLYHPFHILATARSGASAKHSICWETTGLWTFITRFQHFLSGEILLAVTGSLVVLSAVLVPMSAETVRLILHGPECHPGKGNAQNCGLTLGVFPSWSRAVVGILGVMGVLLLVLMVLLWRFHRTGLNDSPWSLTAMAGLSGNQDFQAVLARLKHLEDSEGVVKNEKAQKMLGGFSYALEHRQDGELLKYAIVPVEDARHGVILDLGPSGSQMTVAGGGRSRKAIPFFALTLWGRVIILLVLLGMLTLIITYWALGPRTTLGRWMSSETVGVRILVVTIGMIITLFWSSYFYCVAFMTPYRILNSNPTRASEAVNMNLSTNQFSGLGRSLSFWQGTHDWFLASVAAVALLAEFLPALLSNVPYRVVQTSETHTACVYLSCAVLGLMLLVTCASFLVDWPHMPVDPSTLAGAMYYISPARGGGSGGALVSGHVPAVNTPYSAATTQAYDPPPGAEAGAYIDYTYTNTEALQPIQNSNSDTFHQLPPPAHHQQGVQQEQPTDVTAAAAAAAAAPAPVAVAVTREPSTAPQPASSLYHYEVPPPRT